MKSVQIVFVVLLAIVVVNSHAFGQQWSGENNTSSFIGRTGKVGIGTTTEANENRKLEINAGNQDGIRILSSGIPRLELQSKVGGILKSNWVIFVDPYDEIFGIYDDNAGKRRLTVTKGGFVGIGTNNPESRLHINGSLRVDGFIQVQNLSHGDYGNVQWSGTARYGDNNLWVDTSSKRYKENIKTLTDEFTALLKAEPKTYTRPGNPNRWEIGYIAEDFQALGLTKLLFFDKDDLPEAINYEKICIYLTEIVKQQQEQIDRQQATISNIIGSLQKHGIQVDTKLAE